MINQNTISPYRFFGKKQKTCFSFTTTIYCFAFHVNSCKFNAMKNHKKSRKIKSMYKRGFSEEQDYYLFY